MLAQDFQTLLTISGIGIAPFSTRAAHQTLEPIAATQHLARTVNGTAIDISPPQMRKYTTRISCEDMNSPAIDSIWPGMQLTIGCVAELSFLTGGTAGRAMVSGSLRFEGSYSFYRPQLVVQVTSFSIDTDEWGARVSWSLQGEEV